MREGMGSMSVQHKIPGSCGGYLAMFTTVYGSRLESPPEDTNFGKYRRVGSTKELDCEATDFTWPTSSFSFPTQYKK